MTENMIRTLVVRLMPPSYLNAPSVYYTVNYKRMAHDEDVSSENTEQDEVQITITNLIPFTNYAISVLAYSDAGCGPESKEITQLTIEEGK